MTDRRFDLVLFGATGYTGRLVAEHLARRASEETFRWAIAGRNADKLGAVRAGLETVGRPPEVMDARIDDPGSLLAMAQSARAVLTTAGPFAELGEPVVRACVEAGAHYADITGEPGYVNRIIDGYDGAARERGVCVVPCCGFDSIPPDLGVMYTVRQLPQDEPITCEGFVRARGVASGGTWNSAIGAFAGFRELRNRPRPSEPDPVREARSARPRLHWDERVQAWAVPMPTIDPQIVLRSARVCDGYGTELRYGHYARVKRLPTIVGGAVALGGLFALSQLEPTRELLGKLRPSGSGPTEEQRQKGFFEMDFFASSTSASVHTRVSGGDPGYTETAKMAGEAILCLARDDGRRPGRSGVLTPAAAMGEALLERLQRVGPRFETLQ